MPEIEPVPDHDGIEPIFKLLLIRAMREDRIVAASRDFFNSVLGEDFSGQRQFDIHELWKWSTPQRPIILLGVNNADPASVIVDFAGRKYVSCTLVSMGEGTMTGVLCIFVHHKISLSCV